MELIKKISLMLLGASITTIIIFGIWFNLRIAKLEIATNQIVQFLNQPKQEVSK